MVSMTKETMVQYLKDYAYIQNFVIKNRKNSIYEEFIKYMISSGRYEDATRDYYDKMQRVYANYIYLKYFSFLEDFLLNKDDYLSNNDLNGLENNCTFFTNPKGITNKRIVQLIRDAFNHNDEQDFEKFKMSVNGRYFQIEFKDIRTNKEIEKNIPVKPFIMKFNVEYLINVYNVITNKRQNLLFVSFDIPEDFNIYSDDLDSELDKIIIVHYYFKNKLPKEVIDKFNDFSKTKGYTNEELLERSKQMHEYAKSLGDCVEYRLTHEQKNKIKSLITRYKKYYPDLLKQDINTVMFYFLYKEIPIPALKNRLIDNQIILLSYYMDWNLSLEEILNRVVRIVNEEEIPKSYDEIDKMIHEGINSKNKVFQMRLFKDMLDGEFIQVFPLVMYIDAVITHCCTDEEICIDNVTYSKRKIRNCLVHGRWFVSANNEIVMFDADPRNVNDYKLEYIGKISVDSFVDWANNYMKSYGKENKKNKM